MAYWSDSELARNRRVQDGLLAERHRDFDLSAQDRHMKYERAQFAVVGEGSHEALDAYRTNYDLIDLRA